MYRLFLFIRLFLLLLMNPPEPTPEPIQEPIVIEAVQPAQPVVQEVQTPLEVVQSVPEIGYPFNGSYPFNQGFNNGHQGVDWGTNYYTDILACDTGVVSYVGENDLYGKHIYITHSWGRSLYAHLDWFYVSDGQTVSRGQAIAQSGDSGDSFDHNTGLRAPHLHFGIQINGVWVNPIKYL